MIENISDFARLAAQGATHGGLVFVWSQRFPRTTNGRVRLGDALEALLAANQLPGPDGVIWLAPSASNASHTDTNQKAFEKLNMTEWAQSVRMRKGEF